ncbi:MAG: hypothetical protein Q9174_006584, partial [Haloplaca sp. 1 TL-2023]
MYQSILLAPFLLSVAIAWPFLSTRQTTFVACPAPQETVTKPSACSLLPLAPINTVEQVPALNVSCADAIEGLCHLPFGADPTFKQWQFFSDFSGGDYYCEVGKWVPAPHSAAPPPDCDSVMGALQDLTARQSDALGSGGVVGATMNLAVNPEGQQGTTVQTLALPNAKGS